jgi:RimJ/RimL family protein N-acetyltransferase
MRTRRLTIEPLDAAHAPGLLAALDDELVGRYIGGPDVTTLDALHARIRYLASIDPSQWGERWLNWVVRLDIDPDQPVIGRIEATVHLEHRSGRHIAEVAYVFGPRWGGHGYATEATAWMLDELHQRHDVDIAWATVDPGNDASLALLERLGFRDAPLPEGGLSSYGDGDRVLARPLRETW